MTDQEKKLDTSWMQRAREGHGPWQPIVPEKNRPLEPELKNREQQVDSEREAEQGYVQSFREHRDRLLDALGLAQSFSELDNLLKECHKLLSIAEDLLPRMLFLRSNLLHDLEHAEPRFHQALQLALGRVERLEQQAQRQLESRAYIKRLEREAAEFERRTREETARIRREASDRRFRESIELIRGYSMCPRCGAAKPLAHRYCGCCWESRGFC